MSNGVALLTGEILRQKWIRFADMAGIPDDERLALSEGWLSSFKCRCGLREFKRHGEAGSANSIDVEAERKRICKIISEGKYQLKDVFNMDETGLFYAMPPDRGLRDKPSAGVKGNKKQLTYALTVNTSGSEKHTPLVIGQAAKPRAFQKKTGAQLGFYYRNNVKAWMVTTIYQEWIQDWDKKLRREGRHILLLQDNFSAHNPPDDLTNIRVENFAPNLTAHVQPDDQGIIRCFKAHYRSRFTNRAIDRYDSDVSIADIYKIDQLEAMRIADAAWNDVDASTIRNCWAKAGIIPTALTSGTHSTPPRVPVSSLLILDPPDVSPAEKHLNETLQQLQTLGILRQKNMMNLNELLNPSEEQALINHTSEEDIFNAVTSQTAADEPIDDGNPSDDEQVASKPSRKDALVAASVLREYISDIDSPLCRRLEDSLVSFGIQTRYEVSRTLKPTKISDHFTPNLTF
ncbi:hypothetical protein PLEOSDRAFT_154560 [Pleurotus ostreatus PC15]|uniref:Uncharacterized protein n=1 Tax=Pleurotus ostreatus (strain PC15) TaxID=1137138 RepID=A0A067P931_PLEO1|nr:hypothetical protein PLEOSDRAFT_154560 [Pleurotus ostreatus PC15]